MLGNITEATNLGDIPQPADLITCKGGLDSHPEDSACFHTTSLLLSRVDDVCARPAAHAAHMSDSRVDLLCSCQPPIIIQETGNI